MAAAIPSAVLPPGQVVEANSQSGSSAGAAPADGRLRGPDFTAVVSRVAWPQSVDAPSAQYVAGSAHRLVSFTLSVTQPTDDSGTLNAPTGVSASLRVGAATRSIDLTTIDRTIAGGASGTAETTGTDSFVASVPAREHDVDLVLTQAGFNQSFDLWTLQRLPPSPAVLYRDASSSTVTGSAASSFNVAFTNPADGFSSSDDAQVSSATLSWFAPGGSGTTPGNATQAFLVVGLQSSYPDVPYGQPNSGHFFSSFTPLPGNRLTFTPTGGTAVIGTSSTTVFSSTGAASDDDGLFDSVYWFSVPASTTAGTLTVTAGPATGTEYTGFTGSGNAVPINVTAAATVSLSFPAEPAAPPAQTKPSWVGAALPATGLAAVGAPGSAPGHSPGPPSHPFPLWEAVLLVVLVAAVVVAVQRVIHSRRALSAAGPTREAPTSGADIQAVTTPEPAGQSDAVDPVVAEPVPPPLVRDPEPSSEPCVNVLGPLEFPGLDTISPRGVLAGLLAFLVAPDRRHMSTEQILVAMRPGDVGSDASRKTLRNNLSLLRQQIGAEHLPDASSAGGYLVVGIGSDWATFERLDREADTVGRDAAIALRTEALALVRGKPYEGVPVEGFEWVTEEHLDITIARAIARCACKLAAALLEVGDPVAAEQAVRTGLRAAPSEFSLWEAGARAIDVRGDVGSLRSWLTEASRCLVRSDVARIKQGLNTHLDDDSES